MECSERILFVDDDRDVCTAFARTLTPRGFTLDVANGHDEAVEKAKNAVYAVIATDYRMPKVDGLALIDELRFLQPTATYMLISGECDLELALQAVNGYGLSYVIPKPWEAEDLVSLVRRSIEAHSERVASLAVQESAVHNARRVEGQKEALAVAMGNVRSDVVYTLFGALQVKDTQAASHSVRVSVYARLLAQALGIKKDEAVAIEQAALLHEIGKLALPDSGGASADDAAPWAQLSVRILQSSASLREVREIVEQVHERWDGEGVPGRVPGERIRLGARVIAVADALDTLVKQGDRNMNIERALQDLAAQSGAAYDPDIVSALTALVRRQDASQLSSALSGSVGALVFEPLDADGVSPQHAPQVGPINP